MVFPEENLITTKTSREERVVNGTVLSFGIACGQAYFYKVPRVAEFLDTTEVNIDAEKEKMRNGLLKLRNSISDMLSEIAVILTEESLEIFDIYRLFAKDSIFEKELLSVVSQGKSAYEATEIISQKFRQKMKNNNFWKTRLYDMQYLLRELRKFLQNDQTEDDLHVNQTKRPIILIASYISPADLLYYFQYHGIAGLTLKDAGQTSHCAIVARSLHIPTLGGISLTQKICPTSTQLLIDANAEMLYINPSSSTLERLQRASVIFKNSNDVLPIRTVTKDNIKIDLFLNANLISDLDSLDHPIINGVGLFRTEILFMLPNVSTDFYAQVREYQKIFDKAGNKPVIFRTIDTTDDKDSEIFANDQLSSQFPDTQKSKLKESRTFSKYLVQATPIGQNLVNRYEFLRMQIKALLRARIQSQNQYDPVHIMIPMISDAVELKAYQKIIETEAMQEAQKQPSIISQIKIGVMVEVPALVYQINRIHSIVDFVSIGTNDLFHFFFATNRWDIQSRRTQDALSPAFLQFLGNVVHQFIQQGIPVHVCGEMASNPITAMALIGIGVRRLSIAPNSVWRIAQMINSLPLELLLPYMRQFRLEPFELCIANTAMQYENSVDMRYTLQKFAHEYGVLI
ncbi:MAG: hypothetical protein LBD36_01885 [Holosporales bacterium]|nr:hypothetical protein [Holosporales bacterium]